MKKAISLLVVLVLLTMVFVGCGSPAEDTPEDTTADTPVDTDEPGTEDDTPATPPVETDEPGEQFVIGINNFGQANFFARIGRYVMMEEIEVAGHVVMDSVTADINSRIAAIEAKIAAGVDAIIIQEGDIELARPALEEARAQGIIIASLGAGDADFVDLFVASDEYELGRLAAMEMVYFMGGEGSVLEIYNPAGAMIRARRESMHEVVANYPGISVDFGFVYAWPDFFPDILSQTEALIRANPNPGDIAGVFATFDGAGYAAAAAFREAGLTDYVVIVGIDGDPEAYREMLLPDSPFKATVAQDPETMAIEIVAGVIALLRGENVPQRIEIPGIVIRVENIPEGWDDD